MIRPALILALAGWPLALLAQTPGEQPPPKAVDVYSTSNCMGCHGQSAMGGLGPPLAKTKLEYEKFLQIVRDGKGMMPATKAADLSDEKVRATYDQVLAMPYREDLIPIAYKVASLLTTRNVFFLFLGVFAFAALFALKNLGYWLRCAALAQMWPRVARLGLGKSLWIVLKSFVVDGLLVSSLWKDNKKRWLMHGLILYGFLSLILADILMSIFNPARGDLPLANPLKLLPIAGGLAVLIGVLYVMVRYRNDSYIDNGLTLGKDFLFVNLLFHTTLSGFLTVVFGRMGIHQWVMTIYIYHIASIALLIGTAPFTRFQHAWVVPIMVSLTKLTEAVTAAGVDLGYEREPSPGRHHKSERIAASVLAQIEEPADDATLRYYP